MAPPQWDSIISSDVSDDWSAFDDVDVPDDRLDIAVVGMAGRIAEAESPEHLWQAIACGADLIRRFPEERVADADEIKRAATGRPLGEAVAPYGYLEHIDQFDPQRFGIAPSEAELMEPHQRLFLTAAIDAIENAGYGGDALRGGRTGVYVGAGASQGLYTTGFTPQDPAAAGMTMSGKLTSLIAGRVNHFLDLRGPAVVVDTACSSSMTALVTACRDIRHGVVDQAIAGGVRLTLVPPEVVANGFGIESSSGRTRTFAANSDGTGGGEGVVAYLLKPLSAALADGDHVHGVIRGIAINHDGASVGVTAPNAAAQADLVRSAWRDAGIEPDSVSYIEAHGTATDLGDPVEITGLTEAFGAYTDRRQFCGIGSVKTNVGHLDAAAGVTGLLKVLLMLRHRRVPPSCHFDAPNPKIDFSTSPVYVTDRAAEWDGPSPLRAGISSFGISGTNCHLVVEEAPEVVRVAQAAPSDLVVLSAQHEGTLRAMAASLADHLRGNPNLSLGDISLTLGVGRTDYEYRLAVVARDLADLASACDSVAAGEPDDRVRSGRVVVTTRGGSGPDGHISLAEQEDLTTRAADLCRASGGAPTPDRLQTLAELFVSGARIDWNQLLEGRDVRRVPLPACPGAPRRLWRPASNDGLRMHEDRLHPLVHRHVVEGRDLDVFESELQAETCFELGEHRINGVNVLVGTGLFEAAYTIATRVLGGRCVLTNLHYRDPLVTHGSEVRHLQCVVQREGDLLLMEFRSRLEGVPGWTDHCRVNARREDARADFESVDIDVLVDSYPVVGESVSYHRDMVEASGRYWGSSRALYYGTSGEALLHFDADDATRDLKRSYHLFPPILDSGINLGLLRESDPFLPLAFEEAAFPEDLPDAGYCWIRPSDPSIHGQGDIRVYDVTFTDLNGRVTGWVRRYSVSRVREVTTFLRSGDASQTTHEPVWRPVSATPSADIPAGETVVVAARDVEHPLVAHLARQGASVLRFDAEGLDDDRADEWAALIDEGDLRRVVHVTKPRADGETGDLRTGLSLVSALARRSLARDLELVTVTCRGHAVAEGDDVDPTARALSSAALCYDAEYANLDIRVVDIDDDVEPATVLGLVGAVERRIIAVRGDVAHEPTLVPRPAPKAGADALVREGVVVVTGGLGGMALAFADHFTAAHDSVRIALVNRRLDDADLSQQPDDDVAIRLAALGERRERISLWRADVTSADELEERLQGIRDSQGPIVGVIHTAGLAGDGFALTKPWDEFRRVLAPKMDGVRVLDRATRHDELDFFVLCSSMTSLIGAPGQSDYAAANGYLDGYAAHLRAQGRPAVAVNWTGWRDSGMAHRHGITGDGYFLEFVDDAEGARLLVEAVLAGATQVVAGRFIAEELERQRTVLERVLDTSAVLAAGSAATRDGARGKRTAISYQDISVEGLGGRRPDDVTKGVVEAWCTTLGTDSVYVTDPFFESGGNSLLASRLQLEIEARFPGSVNIADIFVHSTVDQLSGHIRSKLHPEAREPVPSRAAPTPVDDDTLSQLLDDFLSGSIGVEEVIER